MSCFTNTFSASIKYEELLKKCNLSKDIIDDCLNETLFPEWNYIRSSNGFRTGSDLFITECGLSKVEAHKQSCAEHEIVKKSLLVAKIAMWISVVNVIIALISLIKIFI